MGKGKRNKAKRSAQESSAVSYFAERFTYHMKKEIRNSEFWPKMVAEFGEEQAEQLLRECKGELKPEVSNDEAGDCSTDL